MSNTEKALSLKDVQEFKVAVKDAARKATAVYALGYASKGRMDADERKEFWKELQAVKTQEELDALVDYYQNDYQINVAGILRATPEEVAAAEKLAIEEHEKAQQEKRAERANTSREKPSNKKPSVQNAAQKEFLPLKWEDIRPAIAEGTKFKCFIRECEILEVNDEKKSILAFGKFGKDYYEYAWEYGKEIEFDSLTSGRILLADRKSYSPFSTDYIAPVSYEKPLEDNSAAAAIKAAQKATKSEKPAPKKADTQKPKNKKAAATVTDEKQKVDTAQGGKTE